MSPQASRSLVAQRNSGAAAVKAIFCQFVGGTWPRSERVDHGWELMGVTLPVRLSDEGCTEGSASNRSRGGFVMSGEEEQLCCIQHAMIRRDTCVIRYSVGGTHKRAKNLPAEVMQDLKLCSADRSRRFEFQTTEGETSDLAGQRPWRGGRGRCRLGATTTRRHGDTRRKGSCVGSAAPTAVVSKVNRVSHGWEAMISLTFPAIIQLGFVHWQCKHWGLAGRLRFKVIGAKRRAPVI